MATTDPGRVWEDASSPDASGPARRFATAWYARPATPPDPWDFLPDAPDLNAPDLLALLRADLTLRRESGEAARVERYLGRFPALPGDVVAALAYEEFCLREEAGEAPDPAEYEARFPEVAGPIREILDIHEFVESARDGPGPPAVDFPEAGETIAGFRLVGELGRGAIARVFLAEERQLADRPVALKVSRAGSREPEALALLQHTHIVPVHSYRVDPATGLHLLCMPYFGRVTLADVLASPGFRAARDGSDLLAALDALRPPGEPPTPRDGGRAALAGLTFARGVAWWGARLAEALRHAHERGVLHRDVKPSNVLITADGLPMLLDFNLARPSDPSPADDGRDPLGGTLAYMAPEHLEALADADRDDPGVDGRADLYSLGVVLLEALSPPSPAENLRGVGVDGLRALIRERRSLVLGLGAGRRVPGALVAVLLRCLEPDPGDRYASAAELAADLRAVADDGPLAHAREPQPDRALRWASRNRRGVALAAVLVVGAVVAAGLAVSARDARVRREALARGDYATAVRSAGAGEFAAAAAQFAMAGERTGGLAGLATFRAEADRGRREALGREQAREQADAFFRRVEPLKFRLVTDRDLKASSAGLSETFADFRVFGPEPWTRDPRLDRLDPPRRARLVGEVNEVLFLWVVKADRPGDPGSSRKAAAVCDRALTFAEPRGPWRALKARYDGSPRPDPPSPRDETSARACFQWALLAVLDRRPDRALAWLERSVRLAPDRFWYQFALGYHHATFGDPDRALAHYDAALALRPDSAWALFNRAVLVGGRRGDWDAALADLARVRSGPGGVDPGLIGLEAGRVAQRLGDFPTALAAYRSVVAADPSGEPARHARLNRAKIEAESGAGGRARALAEVEALLADDLGDADARFGRALLALGLGRADAAEADLTRLLADARPAALDPARRAGWLAARALARVELGRTGDAGRDADEALRLDPRPGRLRVVARVALASGRAVELAPFDPDDLERLPVEPGRLARELGAAADALRGAPGLTERLTRATLLSALNRHDEARAEVDRAVEQAGHSAEAWLVRARARRRSGDRGGAVEDARRAVALAPGDPRPKALLGVLLSEGGEPVAALAELDRAVLAGAGGRAHAARARALLDLGRVGEVVGAWGRAIEDDPEDADAYLGRARCQARLGRWDPALADLESAAGWSNGRPATLGRVALGYAGCLPARPDRLSRVVGLAARAWAARPR